MNILVCIKQVFDDSVEIGYDETSNKFLPENVEKVENAFDTYALEMATRLKEKIGDTHITLLSIGTDASKNALKNGLAVGGDEATVILNDKYQDSDSYSIANALAQGIKKIEEKIGNKFDIIFCGKETTDYTAGQVGVMLANAMNMGVITDLVDIDYVDGKVVGKHETEMGYGMIEGVSPCVVTVSKPPYDPRYATVKNKMAARKKVIDEISDISLDDSKIVVKKTYSRPKRQAGVKIVGKTPEEAVAQAISLMSDAKVL